MFRVKILKNCRLAVINDNKNIVRRDCVKGENVYIEDLSKQDIKDKIYAPYKNQIVDSSGNTVKVRQRKAEVSNNNVSDAINVLQNAIDNAAKVISLLSNSVEDNKEEKNIVIADKSGNIKNNIPENVFVEEDEEFEGDIDNQNNTYTQQDYASHHNRIRNMIAGIVNDEDRQLQHQSRITHHLPKFANISSFKSEGEELIGKEIDVTGINSLNVAKKIDLKYDDNGDIDVIESLGMKIVNR